MLKCGQRDNKNYTFGLRKEQNIKESFTRTSCSKCKTCIPGGASYCPNCGAKL